MTDFKIKYECIEDRLSSCRDYKMDGSLIDSSLCNYSLPFLNRRKGRIGVKFSEYCIICPISQDNLDF